MRIVVTFHSGGRERAGHQADAAALIVSALEARGHTAVALDVSDALGSAVVQLEALDPDLVFNLSRGRGRHGDLLFPAVLEQLDIPFTGADAQRSAIVRDKRLAKMLVSLKGGSTARSVFTREAKDVPIRHLNFPIIVKPNYEEDYSDQIVVSSPARLRSALGTMLDFYPEGVLLEEYVRGTDITMMWLEERAPYLPAPIGYSVHDPSTEASPYPHHQHLVEPGKVELVVDPALPRGVTRDDLSVATKRVVEALSMRDAAEIQFRVSANGEILFLHASSMPRLDASAPIYAAAKKLTCGVEDVIDAIVRSADRRHGSPSETGLAPPAAKRTRAAFAG